MSSIASTTRKYDQKPISQLSNPIAIRPEHIASKEATLRIYPKRDAHTAADYTIEDVVTGSEMFTVTGKKYGSSTGREFRDPTGLPLFEMRRVGLISRRPFRVRLPGDNEKDLLSLCMRGPLRRIKLFAPQRHATAAIALDDKDKAWRREKVDLKKEEDEEEREDEEEENETVKMEVHRTTQLFTFDVLAGDQKVADIQENLELNKSVGRMAYNAFGYTTPPPKRIMDIRVAEGLDMSIMALLAVFISDMFFG